MAGGNLTLLTASLGTPYEVDTRGCILILEDVREEAYPIDAKLTQLRLAGKPGDAAGIVWAECAGCGPRDYRPTRTTIFTMGEIVDELLASAGVPCSAGLTFGHTDDQATLPLGVEATLDATRGVLIYDQAATSAPVIGGR